MTKRCSRCGEEKTLENFAKSRQTRDGRYCYCRPCATQKRKEWKAQNPERDWNNRRSHHIMENYGISPDEYDRVIASASGHCQVCGIPFGQSWRGAQLDHCHTTGKIRGALCWKCNTGIGLLNDSISNLAQAIDYLKTTQIGGSN